MNIIRVRLHKTKKGNGLMLTFEENINGDELVGTNTHKALIHPDLQTAIDAMGIHLAILTGYLKADKVKDIALPDPKLFEKFHVNGYSIGGDEDNNGVVISGHHILPNGKAVILNSPFDRFDLAPEARYVFMDDLQARIRMVELEISAYLDGTKRGTPAQGELDLGDEFKANPDAMNRVANNGEENGEGSTGKKNSKRAGKVLAK